MGIGTHGHVAGADPDVPTIRTGGCQIANKSTCIGKRPISFATKVCYLLKYSVGKSLKDKLVT